MERVDGGSGGGCGGFALCRKEGGGSTGRSLSRSWEGERMKSQLQPAMERKGEEKDKGDSVR